jgi:hypothetical protein
MTMRGLFAYGFKEIAAAIVLSSFIAGGVGAMTGPARPATGTSVESSVNRILKGDRLPSMLTAKRSTHNSTSIETKLLPTRAPLGCDPAFSTVADPARGHIYRRCMV